MAMGRVELRKNIQLDFVENGALDPALAVYDDDYQNSQAHSPQFIADMAAVLETLKKRFPRNSRLVEVGCGKGDFLEMVVRDGHFDAVGFDTTYQGRNERVQKRYLTDADRLQADIVVLRHVLEHIHRPHLFLRTLQRVCGKAAIYIEVPAYDWILENQAFFDITYEHVNYFSRKALLNLFDGNVLADGLLFGGQYRFIIAGLDHLSSAFAEAYESGPWDALDFEQLFPQLTAKISEVDRAASRAQKVYVWGAATKGCMFLVHCARRNTLIDRIAFAVDVNPGK